MIVSGLYYLTCVSPLLAHNFNTTGNNWDTLSVDNKVLPGFTIRDFTYQKFTFPTRSDTNRSKHSQKKARILKFWKYMYVEEEFTIIVAKTGADQLCS